ncbi:MAG TPA: FadR/GntR family transcriptional regulator [Candidatus Acidoferrales bacterium]|nr:FadR/GntR family transcriptional regulator [Candidatus Acidoferrales bacterium]
MQTVVRQGLTDQVIERVRALVDDRTYRVGDRLPNETELCEMFGVGRSTVREAMRVLANRGVVQVRHGQGTFVASRAPSESFEERVGRADLADIYEARLFLELPLAELAASRRNARDVAAMRAALKKRTHAIAKRDVAAYTAADFAFHLAIARAAKNRALLGVYESFIAAVQPLLVAAMTESYMVAEKDTLHAALCDAIAEGDVREACRFVRRHLNASLEGISGNLA